MQGTAAARKRHNDFIPSNTSQQHDQKRYKYEESKYDPSNPGATTLDAIVECIFGLSDLQDVDVEFIVGKLSTDGRRFSTNLTEQDFQGIYGHVKRQAAFESETDYMYDQGRYNNVSITMDDDGSVTKAIHKEPINRFDMETNLPFDIRVAIARHTHITPLPTVIDDDYAYKRTLARFTVDAKDWQMMITDVTTNEDRKSYELSVKVKMPSVRACADHRACVSLMGAVFVEVHTTLARLQRGGVQLFPDIKLERVTNSHLREYLKREFMQLVPGVHNQDRFPGSQPTPLERSKIKILQAGKYWVSEKSDGLRLMLFFIEGCAYFVDRKMDFFQVHKFTFLVDLFGRKGVTLIDGEMVRHLRSGKLMFLIFDILALNGKTNLGACGLLDRLHIITKQVVDAFRSACKVCNMKDDSSRLQFSLAGKIFRNKTGIELLSDMIKMQESGERLFIDERRCHRNDGLIFTLDGPYLPYSSSHLMKWKYVDRLTIDFRLKVLSEERYCITVGAGKNKEQEIRNFDMTPENWERLKNDIQKGRNTKVAIIECAYDAIKGQWCYLNLRPDKDMPNHYNTMENTKRIVVENITMEEIVYRVARETASDEWEKMHPELFPHAASSPASDKSSSPAVDLPATPVDSPIAYLSPPPSLSQSPSQTPNRLKSSGQTFSSPPPVTYEECTDISNYFNFMPPAPVVSFSTTAATTTTTSQHTLDNIAATLFESPPPLLFESQEDSPTTVEELLSLSPPTSPSAFFS